MRGYSGLLLLLHLLLSASCAGGGGAPGDAGGVDTGGVGPGDAGGADAVAGLPDARSDAGPGGHGPFTTHLIDDGKGFKPRVSIAASNDRVWVAYAVATSSDDLYDYEIRVAEWDGTGAEIVTAAPAGEWSNEYPVMAADGSKLWIAFGRWVPEVSHFDLFVVEGNVQTGFTERRPLLSTATTDEMAPALVRSADGTLHLLYLERADIPAHPGNFTYAVVYMRVPPSGASQIERVAEGVHVYTGEPELAIGLGPDGTVHAVYPRDGASTWNSLLTYRARKNGVWGGEQAVTDASAEARGPSIVVGADGAAHILYSLGSANRVLARRSVEAPSGSFGAPVTLTSGNDDRAYYLGAALHGDDLHVAFMRYESANADIMHLQATAGGAATIESLTDTASGDESCPAITVAPDGTTHVAYVENGADFPNGRVTLATQR